MSTKLGIKLVRVKVDGTKRERSGIWSVQHRRPKVQKVDGPKVKCRGSSIFSDQFILDRVWSMCYQKCYRSNSENQLHPSYDTLVMKNFGGLHGSLMRFKLGILILTAKYCSEQNLKQVLKLMTINNIHQGIYNIVSLTATNSEISGILTATIPRVIYSPLTSLGIRLNRADMVGQESGTVQS